MANNTLLRLSIIASYANGKAIATRFYDCVYLALRLHYRLAQPTFTNSPNKKARNAKDIAGEASWEAFKDRLHPTSE
jgi:hypothetical protein